MNTLSDNVFIQDLIAKWEDEIDALPYNHPSRTGLSYALLELRKQLKDEEDYCHEISVDETSDIEPAYLHA